ncbi:hypothetical protein [Hymenobacter sp. YC55]|uniref:hypothetical protein n=1 Tax=Hymenobacter sp. YC55 TaxID=3034019 RepID=UPI0023F9DD0D|nr:hypothetical protein [Hymenobacter sp. YC55]MDF7814482.1 hypothetical protein [Hymenobacter sp. YC55]
MMRILRRTTVFFAALLLTVAAGKAQTPLGQPSFDEQKVQVWCATAKFVYEDNGRPNLKSTLRCGGSLKEFENSIRADSQRVFSALYQPLEVRGTIYRGLGSNPSRLQKLKTEIISRLKSSPARRANPARMQRLATLETALTNYVENGTPIGDQPEEETAEALDTAADTDEAAAVESGDAGLDEAGVARPTEATRATGESWINKFFGPLALIMALLSLVLYVLMRRNMAVFQKELIGRMTQRQDEIMASRPAPVAAAAPAVAQQLTPELQRQVEELVLQRVEAELAKREVPAPSAPVPAPPTPEPPRVTALPVTIVAPAPPPLLQELEAAAPAPAISSIQDTPIPMTEVAGPPVVIPVGSPATALREDFESVVPPVHLPDSGTVASPETIIRFGKAPLSGVFRDEDFTDELQDDTVYEIFLDPQWPELASFQVSPEPAVQTYLLQSAPPDLLAAACEYEQPTGPVAQIITLEEGILRRVEGVWQVEQKAVVQFEG